MKAAVLFVAFLAAGSAFVLQQQLKHGELLLANGGILGSSQCDLLWIYYQQTNSCYYVSFLNPESLEIWASL